MKLVKFIVTGACAFTMCVGLNSCDSQKKVMKDSQSEMSNGQVQMNATASSTAKDAEDMAMKDKEKMDMEANKKEKMAMDQKAKMEGKMDDMKTKMVGGAEMYPTKDIVTNAMNSKDHTTLVAAVKAAGLVKTLQGDGPFTVFAPTNEAFDKLPDGTVETLLKPENKSKLQSVLTYHVLAGKYSAMDIMDAIKKGDGQAEFTTVNGEKLTAMMNDGKVQLKDASGDVATVTIADVNQKNGVIHVVDTVMLPQA